MPRPRPRQPLPVCSATLFGTVQLATPARPEPGPAPGASQQRYGPQLPLAQPSLPIGLVAGPVTPALLTMPGLKPFSAPRATPQSPGLNRRPVGVIPPGGATGRRAERARRPRVGLVAVAAASIRSHTGSPPPPGLAPLPPRSGPVPCVASEPGSHRAILTLGMITAQGLSTTARALAVAPGRVSG